MLLMERREGASSDREPRGGSLLMLPRAAGESAENPLSFLDSLLWGLAMPALLVPLPEERFPVFDLELVWEEEGSGAV